MPFWPSVRRRGTSESSLYAISYVSARYRSAGPIRSMVLWTLCWRTDTRSCSGFPSWKWWMRASQLSRLPTGRETKDGTKGPGYRSATTWNAMPTCLSYAGPTVLSWRLSVPGTWTSSKWSGRFGRIPTSGRGISSSLTFESAPHPLPSDRPPTLYLVRSQASAAYRLCRSLLLRGREGLAQHGGCENTHGDKDDVHRYRHETLPVPTLFR
jgi:hypothetical protein